MRESSPQPFALTVVMLVASVAIYVVGKGLFGRQGHAMYSKASRASDERALPRPTAWLATGLFAGVTLLAVVPHIGVVLTSVAQTGSWYRSVLPRAWTLHHFQQALSHPDAFGSIMNALKLSVAAVALDLVFGLLAAYLIVRTRIRGRVLLDTLCMMPLAVPGLVLAFGYMSMTQDGKAFAMLNPGKDPTLLLVIAYAVRRLPYVVRSAVAGLQQTSVALEEAAQNLGCPPLRALRRVTFPLIAANVLAGGLLAFSFAMLEVSDSLILAQKQGDFPITKAIYELFNMIGDGKFLAAALGVWAMCFLGLTIAIASKVLGKKLGALFRA